MAEGAAAAAQAKERRKEQLRQWARSCTNQEAAEPRWQQRRKRIDEQRDGDAGRTVRFERAAEFLAACAGGDLLEAEEMLRGQYGKEIIDSTNADGISALHQACIDENLEVVEFLVNHGANVNQADNEGWTPLHVAASCGYMEIAEYLLKHSANIAAVNSDGDVPLDIAEDDCMETLLRAEIEKRGIDIEAAKREEEEVMLQDARQWLNAGKIEDIRHPKTGASALHVAAAKGYVEIMRLLLQAGFDPNVQDKDGWTPLHAAAHWGVEEACRLLVENFCDMNALNNVGQRPCDVADEEIVNLLEELQKKQEDLRSEKEASLKRAVIDTGIEQPLVNTSKHRRSSVCRMSSKEKISVQDQSKEKKTLGTITVGDEEGSSSSEEELESTNDSNVNMQVNENGLLPEPKNSTLSPVSYDEKNIEPCLAYIQPTPARKIFSLQDSDSLTNAKEGRLNKNKVSFGQHRATECGLHMKLDMVPTTQLHTNTLTSMTATTSTLSSSTSSTVDPRDKRRSYQTPVRDEESESQRKARSRLMRQSRRSTQGVTLTDLKEAEKTQGKSVDSTQASNVKECDVGLQVDKEQLLEQRKTQLALNTESCTSLSVNTVNSSSKKVETETTIKGDSERDISNHFTLSRDRRKWRREHRAANTGLVDSEDPEAFPHIETSGYRVTDSLNSIHPYRAGTYTFPRHKDDDDKDYKKLYENLLSENETLREQLQESELKLTQLRLELERVTQRQERHAERPALLELERFERRALERKAAELEEELKVLSDLKADNQRLKDENAALIRVISKLSK
ncbi:protein phosphatase 1 regulatory subunit 12C isoform X8 [Pyxicephalus adspersus]|uniref:protein phosphatase 1 regulatory subunit 12C isoform X8 n=1 Tax=Pyxicephalus adspersus TaxID=30357 RepID=UPI003B5C9433